MWKKVNQFFLGPRQCSCKSISAAGLKKNTNTHPVPHTQLSWNRQLQNEEMTRLKLWDCCKSRCDIRQLNARNILWSKDDLVYQPWRPSARHHSDPWLLLVSVHFNLNYTPVTFHDFFLPVVTLWCYQNLEYTQCQCMQLSCLVSRQSFDATGSPLLSLLEAPEIEVYVQFDAKS